MTLYGPDLSNNNWASFAEIAGWLDDCFHREGYTWMEHKVSEGNYYRDPYWPTVRDWCNANNVPVIGYHYVTTNDPASQAAKFIANGGGANVMLDFEANSGGIDNFWAVVRAFNAVGVNVALSYLPHWYWQQIGSPSLVGVPGLVSSSYFERGTYGSIEYQDARGDSGIGWLGYGGVSPVIWQFSDGAIIDGKSVDVNAFRGTVDELRTLLGYAPAQPDPASPTGGNTVEHNPPAVPKPADEAGEVSEVWDQELIRWDFNGGRTNAEMLGALGAHFGISGCVDVLATTNEEN
ncbi:hypothetical protein [Mycolicibacter heraklionensis]|uniref:hypothetical protein n=1 Tax=Mycolicibacter heraklionensis TaxID=512402 RepID=UPI00069AACC5|nr:hypothetical protein [Mycolicibacter heraklionensis]